MKGLRVFAITFFLLIIISAGTLLSSAFYYNSSTDALSSDVVVFQVDKGASFNSIALELEKVQLVRSAMFLKIFNKVTGSKKQIKMGSYNIDKNSTSLNIVKQLVEGKQKLLPIVIPEGLTVTKIASILSEAGIVESEDFIEAARDGSYLNQYGISASSLEGFLFPETYSFQKKYSAEKIVQYMVDTFFVKLKSIYPDYKMLTEKQLYEKIILSSIIEKEYRVAEEASMMASVFYNRIDKGWALQSCATIVYVLTEEQMKEHPDRILFSDLEIDSEFNTYQNKGLPPAPISNPGVVALSAVFNPAQTDYMFFVVKSLSEGTHIFTKRLSDHNQARASYINNFRSK